MFDFLPLDFKTKAQRLYRGRLILLYVCAGCVLFLVSFFLLLPSQMLALAKKKSLEGELSALKQSLSIKGNSTVESFVDTSKEKMSVVESAESVKLFSDSLAEFFSYYTSGISLNSMTFERGEKQNIIRMSGVAETRDALLDFSKSLKSNHRFESVDLPVSNLARNKDIDFSITVMENI
ncbi:MAG TPA: hypothetical protein PLB51_02770 [Candidatus Paceibacterota bacterium]|jgi:hypothetical protein|nr:hypothetical protein [Candidatus Paceibacterota bacterium]